MGLSLWRLKRGARVGSWIRRIATRGRSRLTILVLALPPTFAQNSLTLTCGPASSAQVGVNYTNDCSLTGGKLPYQWRVDFLPLGLAYRTAATIPVPTLPVTATPIAIQISGIPAMGGPYAYRITVTDSTTQGAQTATQTVTGTVQSWTQGPIISGIFGAGLSNPPVTQVTPDGLIAILGANFTPGITHSLQNSDLVDGNSLPTNLAQTCVRIGGLMAPVYFVSPSQVNAQVPDLPPTGNVNVSVITNCGATNEAATQLVSVSLAAAAPEFLSYVVNSNGADSVAAVGPNGGLIASPGLLPGIEFDVAESNESIAIFGIGFGAAIAPVPAGMWSTAADPVAATPTVTIGPYQAQILYAGLAPGLAGVYQLNVAVPQIILTGNQPISIQVNGATSPVGAYLPTSGFDLQGSAGIASFQVMPANVAIQVGQTAQFGWEAKNFPGFLLELTTRPAWISSNPQVAFVSASGEVIGVSPGGATITALFAGVSGRATVTVASFE